MFRVEGLGLGFKAEGLGRAASGQPVYLKQWVTMP